MSSKILTKTWVHESPHKIRNSYALHWEVGDDFGKIVHDVVHHNHHGKIGHEERCRANERENRSRTNEQPCSNGTTKSSEDLVRISSRFLE